MGRTFFQALVNQSRKRVLRAWEHEIFPGIVSLDLWLYVKQIEGTNCFSGPVSTI